MSSATAAPSRLASRILFIAEAGPLALPRWAQWFIEFGAWAVEVAPPDGAHLFACVTTPTRAFGAVMCAVGAAAAAFGRSSAIDPEAHWELLAQLPPGTGVRLREGRRIRTGRVIGQVERDGVRHLRIALGDLTLSRPWHICTDVEPLPEGAAVSRQRRSLCDAPDFVSRVLGTDPLTHASHTALDCVIVGTKEHILDELDVELAAAERPSVRGRGQDLLRAKELLPGNRHHYRSHVISAYSEEVPADLNEREAGAVVLDGPTAVLGWKGRWHEAPVVGVVERGASSAEDAVVAFRADLAAGQGRVDLRNAPAPPAGVELDACWARVL